MTNIRSSTDKMPRSRITVPLENKLRLKPDMENKRAKSDIPLTAKGYLESPAAIEAKRRWAENPRRVKVCERFLKNWLSLKPKTTQEFEIENRKYREEFFSLPGNAYAPKNNVYSPTAHGLALFAAMGVTGAKKVADQCNKTYVKLRKIYVSSQPGWTIQVEELASQVDMTVSDTLRALDFLNDLSVSHISSIVELPATAKSHPTFAQAARGEESVQVFGAILNHADIWSWFEAVVVHFSAMGLPLDTVGQVRSPILAATIELHVLGMCPAAKENAEKALERLMHDPAAAITSARSLVEAAIKWVASELKMPESALSGATGKQLKECFNAIGDMGPENDFKKPGVDRMVAGMETAINGLDSARNKMADSHGPAPGDPQPNTRIAAMVVGLAISVTTFLLQSYEARKRP